MRKVIPDTNIWIDWLNTGRHEAVLFGRETLKYLSAIVLMELYAGAASPTDRRNIGRIHRTFQRVGRIVLPTVDTIANAGQLLQRLRWQAGEGGKKKAGFSHDVLIALSARQLGATVLTSNAVDFERIRSLTRFEFEVPAPS